jgi:hypothetical protein
MNKNRIEVGADQGERADGCDQGWIGKSGGGAVKQCVLTWEISPCT